MECDLMGKKCAVQSDIHGNIIGRSRYTKRDSLPEGLDIFMSGRFSGSRATCCIAREFGFKMGVRSDGVQYDRCLNCKSDFVDNEFLAYDHQVHVDAVLKIHPKVATIRDYFNEQQCKELGVPYYTLDELQEHGKLFIDNGITPIIIPKFESAVEEISRIDDFDKYIVGLSFAAKWGAVKRLPVKSFIDRGYKIHLLGGDPSVQITEYAKYPENIISMDSAVIPMLNTSKIIWHPKSFTKFVNRNRFEVDDSTPFPAPGYASASLIASMSFTNLYEFIIETCGDIV